MLGGGACLCEETGSSPGSGGGGHLEGAEGCGDLGGGGALVGTAVGSQNVKGAW